MSCDFAGRVEQGLQLSRRIYYGKGVALPPPVIPEPPPARSPPENFLPTAVTAYSAIYDPVAVDNPDVPSYQPYVHARCDPPALVPLQMLAAEVRVDCWLDTAVVTFIGRWRVHCLMACRRADCCIAVPMGEKGSLLGADIDILSEGRSYKTKLVTEEELAEVENSHRDKDSRFVKPHIYTFKIPQIDGGSIFSVQVTWSQKLLYLGDGQFHLTVPFRFPAYVTPFGKDITKMEKVVLNMNSGLAGEIAFSCTSHPLKVVHREVGRLNCLYEAEVAAWSRNDFDVLVNVSSGELSGNVLNMSPSPWDSDDRGMFCLYILPRTSPHRQVFKRKVVFLIDVSGSMQGMPLENVKKAMSASLSKLNPEDAFNIIAFNEDIRLFSPSMELATAVSVSTANQWLDSNLIASSGTDIMLPLKQAMKLLEGRTDVNAISLVFLVTDGSVENEREICNAMKGYCCRSGGMIPPRICTFGIGSFCNHYFLQMLARIGKGYYDAALDTDSIEHRMKRLFETSSSTIVANTTLDALKLLGSVEMFPSHIPDLTMGDPLIVWGRYKGQFPDSVEVRGTLADTNCFVMELTVQKAKDMIMPLDKVLARRQIDELTARAWFEDRKEIQEKVKKLSIETGFPCEYTPMVLFKQEDEKIISKPLSIKEILRNPPYEIQKHMQKKSEKSMVMGTQSRGFGNADATAKNVPSGREERREAEGAEKLVRAVSRLGDRVCCMCCLRCVSGVNDQCTIVFSQICAALACFECLNCCFEVCGCLDV
ncbi:PREDICTED: uncharacterized protein LOC104812256 [Tarenaya hassleriana]|uniref:uncharacterized protein LOC104812256 n=1 Tax=Tarenaya hassleriana TaxID=28532 RepID=UPI00053C9991|nr:PREDICTED: uncharacterized protein LOC104812256 [Tarenaya hassleriana]